MNRYNLFKIVLALSKLVQWFQLLFIVVVLIGVGLYVIDPMLINGFHLVNNSIIFSSEPPANGIQISMLTGVNSLVIYVAALRIVLISTLLWMIFNQVKKIIRSIDNLSTFHLSNINSLDLIGKYLLGIAVLKLIRLGLSGDKLSFSLDVEVYPIATALLVFVIAEVFKEGNKLKQESDLTI
jgi:hypothetical protein